MSMTHAYLRKVTVVTSVFYNINNTNIKELSDKSIQWSYLNKITKWPTPNTEHL